jgi:hypothetical protein
MSDPKGKIEELRRRAEGAGRNPKSISISIFGVKPDSATIDSLKEIGVDRAIFGLPAAERDEVMPLLDKYARLIA